MTTPPGDPQQPYGQPPQPYGAPQGGYGAPPGGYGPPQGGYGPPPGGYYPPPPPQPYATPGSGGYPPPKPPTNWWAIAALVFGIIGGVLISVVCGIIGLRKAKEGQGGRGLAIAGLVLSGLWVVLLIIGILLFVVIGRGSVDATDVKVGDCITEIPDTTRVLFVEVVDCAEPHMGEVFSEVTLPDGDFPGQAAIEAYQERCEPALASYSPDALFDPSIGLFVLYPTEESWGRGDRVVTCIATSESPRTGSLKG